MLHGGWGDELISFPASCGSRWTHGDEDALAHTPVFAGIAKPPQQMPACQQGAG